MAAIYGVNEGWRIKTNFDGFGSGIGGASAYANCIGRDVLVSHDGGATWQPLS